MEVVFDADDIVFAGVFAHLNFNDDQRELAFVLQAVNFTHRDVSRFIRTHVEDVLAHGHGSGTAYDHPVFRAVQVLLQAEALARLHHDTLHLVAFGRFQHGIRSPRAAHGLRHVNEVGTAFLEFFHHLLHFLAAAERSDQEGVRGVHDEHLVEVDRRDGTLGAHHKGILGIYGDVARVHIVAVFVMLVFAIKAIETAEVAPADIARNHLHLVGLFHDGIVDRIRRDSHHVVAVNADGFTVFDSRIGKALFRGGEHFRGIFAQFGKECLCRKAEDTAVPVEVPCQQVLFGSSAVGLFHEALYVFAIGFDVAVARFGAGGRNAERHQVTGLCQFFGAEKHLLVFVLLANHVVRRRHENNRFGVHGKTGKGDSRGGVTAHGFQQELATRHAFRFKLVLGQEELVGVRNNKLGFANSGVRDHGLAEQGLSVKERGELLGHQGTAHGPKARARTTTKNQVNHNSATKINKGFVLLIFSNSERVRFFISVPLQPKLTF